MPSGATAYLGRCDWIHVGQGSLRGAGTRRQVPLLRPDAFFFFFAEAERSLARRRCVLVCFRMSGQCRGARMAAMFTCCLGCCGDGGSGHIPLKEMPTVQLDTHHMGESARVRVRVPQPLSGCPRRLIEGFLLPLSAVRLTQSRS